MFSKKILYIHNNVYPSDKELIINYFDKFDIAKIKNIEICMHDCCENYDNNNYFAIIEIEEYYNNTCARNFYENIENNNCKMVFNDPYYWTLVFYAYPDYYYNYMESKELHSKMSQNNLDYLKENYFTEKTKDNINQEEEEEEEEEELIDDTNKDPDYIYKEDYLNEDEYKYEYEFYKKLDSEIKSKDSKKRKFNSEIEDLKEKNNTLKKLLIKRNKNYLKKNKAKSFKMSWNRRLRTSI